MTYLPPDLDRAAGSAARRLLRWAGGRRGSAPGTWIRALSAEVDQIDTGFEQLAWALGVLPLVLAERGTVLGHRWRPRLLWLATAGGLGGMRVYGPAVASGIAMLLWIYAHLGNLETDAPLIAAIRILPFYLVFYVLRGLLAARRRSDDAAAAVGATTAVVGFLVVVFGAALYGGITVSPMAWVALPLTGLPLVFVVAAVGAVCGLLGAALAHPATTVRTLRSRHRRP